MALLLQLHGLLERGGVFGGGGLKRLDLVQEVRIIGEGRCPAVDCVISARFDATSAAFSSLSTCR
jgi:hypothetical protein